MPGRRPPAAVLNMFGHVGTPRAGFADLTPEHRYFALAVLPGRVAAARSAGFWRGLMLGLTFGGLGGLWVMTLVLR